MKSANYWKKRMESIEDMSHSKGVAYANNVEQQFRQAQKVIDAKIERWYQRLADNNEISLSAAKKLLNDDELEDFHMDVKEYIEKGKTLKYDEKWAKQLENASAKVHISRLEAIKLQMQQQCEELYGNMTDGLDAHLRDVYTNGYYHTAYEIQKGLNVGWAFNRLDERKIEKAINSCWTNDSKTFKARCWTNKTKLVNELNTVLTQSIIRGEDPQKAINQLAHRMKVSKYNAGRLIMTESAAISSMSQHDCFKELDVEEFEFVATLDSHTSEICRAMDGKHFKMSDYTIGLNAPPLHCFCRSCTVPYFADDVGERIARREDGSTYYVSSDTTYEKWKKSFVDGESKDNLTPITSEKQLAKIIDNIPKPKEKNIESINNEATDTLLKSYDDRRKHFNLNMTSAEDLRTMGGMNPVTVDYKGVSLETAQAFDDTIQKLQEEYYSGFTKIEVGDKKEFFGANIFATTRHNNAVGQKTLILNPHKTSDYNKMTERIKELSDKGYAVKIANGLEGQYVATHEFAHSLIDLSGDYKNYVGMDVKQMKGIKKELDSVFKSYKSEVNALESVYKEKEFAFLNGSLSSDISIDELSAMQKEAVEAKQALDAVKISKYSLENADEFMAEAFTQSKIGISQSKYSEKVMKILDENFKKDVKVIN